MDTVREISLQNSQNTNQPPPSAENLQIQIDLEDKYQFFQSLIIINISKLINAKGKRSRISTIPIILYQLITMTKYIGMIQSFFIYTPLPSLKYFNDNNRKLRHKEEWRRCTKWTKTCHIVIVPIYFIMLITIIYKTEDF